MWPRSSASDRSLCGAYLNMPRGVFWTPLDRWSVRQSQVTSPASFPSELFDWQLRIRISEVTSVPLCPTSKGKTIFRASIHPSSQPLHRLLCILRRFLLYTLKRGTKPLYFECPEQPPLRDNQTKANWKDETMIEHNEN